MCPMPRRDRSGGERGNGGNSGSTRPSSPACGEEHGDSRHCHGAALQDSGGLASAYRSAVPNTWVEARFLDGGEPNRQRAVTPRQALSEWIARGDNPWFARAAVNRLWHYFLGIGLIDPVDGLGSVDNPPSHPELFDELVRQFVAHDLDLKFLIRAITGSRTYQRSSQQTRPGQADLAGSPAPRAAD